jgi:kynurenine formamidase
MEIIDLSHTIKHDISVYPGEIIPVIKPIALFNKDGYLEHKIILSTHHGTHVDCPSHMIPDGFSTTTEKLSSFYGRGMVIDCREFLPAALIPREYLTTYEKKIADADFLLIYTGMDRFWKTEDYIKSFPVLMTESAEYLSQFSIKGIGIDALSLDSTESKEYQNHITFLSKGTIIIENLTGLEQLLDKKFFFTCFPLKIENGDGSPVRACAILY